MYSGLNVNHLELSYNVVNKFSVLGIALAALIPVISKLKMVTLAKLFGMDLKEMENAIGVFILGIAIYLSVFGAGFVGLFIISAIISISAFYQNIWLKISVSAIVLAMMGNLALHLGVTEVDLMGGDVLFGAFIGAFGVYILSRLFDDENKNIIVSLVIVFIALGASFGLGYAGFSHANMGGLDALIAVLFGAAILNAFKGNVYASTSLSSTLFVLCIVVPHLFVNEELDSFEKEMVVANSTSGESIEVELADMDEIEGAYQILADSSKISFYLGQKDETKGAFKKVNGSIVIAEKPSESEFNIELSLSDLTTFNKFRNESLMGPEYFDAEKFPKMTFTSEKMEKMSENVFEAKGTFEMLGVQKPQVVTVKRLKTNEGVWLVGEGTIDRTIYGMTPSSTEGNIVTFSYKVLLK